MGSEMCIRDRFARTYRRSISSWKKAGMIRALRFVPEWHWNHAWRSNWPTPFWLIKPVGFIPKISSCSKAFKDDSRITPVGWALWALLPVTFVGQECPTYIQNRELVLNHPRSARPCSRVGLEYSHLSLRESALVAFLRGAKSDETYCSAFAMRGDLFSIASSIAPKIA